MKTKTGLVMLGGMMALGIILISASVYAQVTAYQYISISVTPGYIEIQYEPTTFDFGTVRYNRCYEATKSSTGSGTCYALISTGCQTGNTTIVPGTTLGNGCFRAANVGTIPMFLYLNVSNAQNWKVGTSPAQDVYQINVSIANITHIAGAIIATNNTLLTDWWNVSADVDVGEIAAKQNVTWDMRLYTPTTSTVTAQQKFEHWIRGVAS